MNRLLLYIIILFVIISCDSQSNYKKEQNEITKVVFSSGPCWGYCPVLSIEIDNKLNFKLSSDGDAVFRGFYKGEVGQFFWDTLKVKLKNCFYDKIDTLYNFGYEHDRKFEIIIYDNLNTKKIKGGWRSAPDDLQNVLNWLENSYQYVALKKVDTLIFETNLKRFSLNHP